MIDIGKILKRSWQILWDYKTLWIFGFLLSLTTGGGGGNGSSNSGIERRGQENSFDFGQNPALADLGRWLSQNVDPIFQHPEQHISTFIWMGIAFFLLVLLISLLAALIRYPSEVAVIRMVDEYEQNGVKSGFRSGWRLGWSRRAFHLWLVDLILSLPVILLVAMFLGVGLLLFLGAQGANSTHFLTNLGVIVLCALPFIFVFILFMAFLMLLRNLFSRLIAIEDVSVLASFRRGWDLFKQNWKSVGLMWLIMFVIGIGYVLVTMIAFFLLIPAYIVLLLPATLVSAVPGLIALAVASLFTSSPLTWIIAVAVALPFFLMIVFAPLIFLRGWYLIYESNIWTLTYRELLNLQKTPAGMFPAEE